MKNPSLGCKLPGGYYGKLTAPFQTPDDILISSEKPKGCRQYFNTARESVLYLYDMGVSIGEKFLLEMAALEKTKAMQEVTEIEKIWGA